MLLNKVFLATASGGWDPQVGNGELGSVPAGLSNASFHRPSFLR